MAPFIALNGFQKQEYQSKIDRLQAELQAVRDKEGAVYLPQEMYDEQSKKLEMSFLRRHSQATDRQHIR